MKIYKKGKLLFYNGDTNVVNLYKYDEERFIVKVDDKWEYVKYDIGREIWMFELLRVIETWRVIKGYEGLYEISSFGRLKGIKHNIIRKLRMTPDGYSKTKLSKNGKQKTYTIHRLVADAFIPNIENKPQVNHINGKRGDNYIKNLEWVTALENMQHIKKLKGSCYSSYIPSRGCYMPSI